MLADSHLLKHFNVVHQAHVFSVDEKKPVDFVGWLFMISGLNLAIHIRNV